MVTSVKKHFETRYCSITPTSLTATFSATMSNIDGNIVRFDFLKAGTGTVNLYAVCYVPSGTSGTGNQTFNTLLFTTGAAAQTGSFPLTYNSYGDTGARNTTTGACPYPHVGDLIVTLVAANTASAVTPVHFAVTYG